MDAYQKKTYLLSALAILGILGGLFSAGMIPWPQSLTTPKAGFNNILIKARGTSGQEKAALYINGNPIQFWNLTTNWGEYTYTPPQSITVNTLSVHFLNDRWEPQNNINYDMQVDYITVNGTKYESEHQTTISTGTWTQNNRCASGYKQTEWLHCAGSFTYNVPGGTVVGLGSGNQTCGNGMVESGETCDDGNMQSEDGCSATCQLELSDSSWENTILPPTLSNPQYIELTGDDYLTDWPAYSVMCAGKVNIIRIDNDADAIVKYTGTNPMEYPLWIAGGRNVHVIGVDIKLKVQPGCEPGKITLSGESAGKNIHPAIPGGMALRLQQEGISFLEGAMIDVNGHDADAIVVRNHGVTADDQVVARELRDVIIVNSRFVGIEGQGASAGIDKAPPIGDGIHGDWIQTQGHADVLRLLYVENVVVHTSQEGAVVVARGAYKQKSIVMRNHFVTYDPRFIGDDQYDNQLYAAAAIAADSYTLENVYSSNPGFGGLNTWVLDDVYRDEQNHPNITNADPPIDFAPASALGVNYLSPYGK